MSPTCEKHGHHAGICWRCAEEDGRRPALVLHALIDAADALLAEVEGQGATYGCTRDALRAAIAEAKTVDGLRRQPRQTGQKPDKSGT